jgi:hypothetical protein
MSNRRNKSKPSLGSNNDSKSEQSKKPAIDVHERWLRFHQMTELEKRVKDHLGEDGLRKLSGLDRKVDPIVLAQMAARFALQTNSRRGFQQALVRAALLLKEANSIVKDGPTIYSMPPELLEDYTWERWSPDFQKLVEIGRIEDPKNRFLKRAKLITGQKKSDRAEEDLHAYWSDQAAAEGRTDVDIYKKEWRERVENLRDHELLFLNMKGLFLTWKQARKSTSAREAARQRAKKRSL